MSLPAWLCPPVSFGLVISQKQKALPKGTDVGAARPAALCLVAAPAAEPSKSSQGEGLRGGKSGEGAKGEQPQEHPNTGKLQQARLPQGGTE